MIAVNSKALEESGTVLQKITWGPVQNKGRGVFCIQDIKKGELIEYAPAVPFPKSEILPDSTLDHYVFVWNAGSENEQYCFVGGYLLLYNHSENPNVLIEEDHENIAFRVTALRDIKKGEEILWHYGCELWFEPRE